MIVHAALMSAALLLVGPAARGPAPLPATHTIDHCLVSLINEAMVPAKEAGVLVALAAHEGDTVKKDQLLAQIDDFDAQAADRVAVFKLQVAKEEAASDVNIRFSRASSEVAQAEYQAALEANRRMPGTVPETEVRRLLLSWRKATLEIEKSQMDYRIAGLKAKVSDAERGVAEENLRRRKILSPLDGEVNEVTRHEGEWVKPGDSVLHIVRLDRLRVEGLVNSAELNPGELAGRSVNVLVDLARGQIETFPGKVTFVKSVEQAGRDFRVWAEVDNRQVGGQWLLRPGATVKMIVQLK